MSVQSILLPLFIQTGLTFFLAFLMGKEKRGAYARKELRWQDIALRQTPWPAQVQKVTNSFENQFEIPVLFYILVILALVTKKADLTFVVMEWSFAASRLAHAFVHTTSNYVPARGFIYVSGVIVLFLMWVFFAVRIYFLPSAEVP